MNSLKTALDMRAINPYAIHIVCREVYVESIVGLMSYMQVGENAAKYAQVRFINNEHFLCSSLLILFLFC